MGRLAVPLILTVFASLRLSVHADCTDFLQSLLASPTCSQLQATQTKAGADANGRSCDGIRAINNKYYPSGTPTECCGALRDMVTSGCACDDTFIAFAGALVGLDLEAARKVIAGSVLMIQTSSCADAAAGGPLLDSCTGNIGPCTTQ